MLLVPTGLLVVLVVVTVRCCLLRRHASAALPVADVEQPGATASPHEVSIELDLVDSSGEDEAPTTEDKTPDARETKAPDADLLPAVGDPRYCIQVSINRRTCLAVVLLHAGC